MKIVARVVYVDDNDRFIAAELPKGIFILRVRPEARGLVAQKGPDAFVRDSYYARALACPFAHPPERRVMTAQFTDEGAQVTPFENI